MGDESTIMKINHSPTGNRSNHHLVNQNVMLLILSSVTCSVSKIADWDPPLGSFTHRPLV